MKSSGALSCGWYEKLWEAAIISVVGHLEFPLMLGVAAYLLLIHDKGRSGREKQRPCDITLGGVCLCLAAGVAWGLEVANLPTCVMGILFWALFAHGALQPVQRKAAGDQGAMMTPIAACAPMKTNTASGKRRVQATQCSTVEQPGKRQTFTRRPCILEVQAMDIVRTYTPRPAEKNAASRIAHMTRKCILPVIPEAEVEAIPGCNYAEVLKQGLQPEMDVVVTVAPGILVERLRQYLSVTRTAPEIFENPAALQKKVTKVLSDRLSFAHFWRSQLTSPECKIVLVTDAKRVEHPIYMSFYVNARQPLRWNTLLSQCCVRRARLQMVVAHWARQRCIVNVQRGHLPKYAWAALVWYFCQPSTEAYQDSESIMESFYHFAKFCFDRFCQNGQLSFCSTESAQIPTEKTLLHLPYIQDPLEPANDLAEHATADGFARAKEELQRALDILAGRGDEELGDLFKKKLFEN